MTLKACYTLLILLGSIIMISSAKGNEETIYESFQAHGFLTQSYLLTSNNNVFGESRSGGSLDFRELGVNASLRPLPDLQLAAQLLSRRAGKGDDGDIRLDYGFADFTVYSSPDIVAGIRAGRVTTPLGFYNDTRDVAFTRNGIFLPQSIYFDRTRNLALSADGGGLYGEWRTDIGDFYLRGVIGVPRTEDSREVERSFLGGDLPGRLEGDTSFAGQLMYEWNGGQIRTALTAAQLNVDYEPNNKGDPYKPGTAKFEPVILSAQYNTEVWSFTGEYAVRPFSVQGVFSNDITGESYYLQASYRLTPDWEVMARFDKSVTDRDDRNGRKYEIVSGKPAFTRFSNDWTVGARWDVTSNFMLRAEYHRVDGTAWLPLEDNPEDLNRLSKRWDLYALLASYRF